MNLLNIKNIQLGEVETLIHNKAKVEYILEELLKATRDSSKKEYHRTLNLQSEYERQKDAFTPALKMSEQYFLKEIDIILSEIKYNSSIKGIVYTLFKNIFSILFKERISTGLITLFFLEVFTYYYIGNLYSDKNNIFNFLGFNLTLNQLINIKSSLIWFGVLTFTGIIFSYLNFSKESQVKEKGDLTRKYNELLSQSEIKESIVVRFLLLETKKIEERLTNEISSIAIKANVNLSIGAGTTLVALVFLFSVVLTPSSAKTIPDFMNLYFPKISIVVFVEIFSFYFLSIYKSNLRVIKYYHDYLTEINFKLGALISAILINDSDTIKLIQEKIATHEKNTVLQKGETTIGLEQYKVDNQHQNDLINKLMGVIKIK